MVDEPDAPVPFSLRRWSQRKHDAAREASAPAAVPSPAPSPAAIAPAAVPAATTGSPALPVEQAPPLPPVESLTIDSDFGPFMQPKVAEDVKRAALKKLFSDPQFNVMDGLDIYVGDYTQPDPMPAGMLDKLGKVYGMLAKDEAPAATDAASHASAGEREATAAAPTDVDAHDAGALDSGREHAVRTAPPPDAAVEVAADESLTAPAAPALAIPEATPPSASAPAPSATAAPPSPQVLPPATRRPSA